MQNQRRIVNRVGFFSLSTILFFPALFLFPGNISAVTKEVAPGRTMARQATKKKSGDNTADHSKFEVLRQEFKTGPEVTKACLSCHTEAASHFMDTIHWTWLDPKTEKNLKFGKGGLSVNNYCNNISSNEPRCTSCHAGYGWKDKEFDFTKQTSVDCLVCHEQTKGGYKKFPSGAGHPVSKEKVFAGNNKTYYPPDWNNVAQSVGKPARENCGTCHFYGGGGDGVKHGDLDSSLFNPKKDLDVHMGIDGQNFTCVRCHSTTRHDIAGRVYATPSATQRKSLIEDDLASKIACESCHSSVPHRSGTKANDHTDKVACQTCHIPTFARVNPTKMRWDWSKAGKKKDGKFYKEKGPFGKAVYMTEKGEFRWAKDVKPEYFWYNGSLGQLTVNDIIDPAKTVKIRWPVGSHHDKNSRIFPFKVNTGKQPYDKVNNKLVIFHSFGTEESGAFWETLDWDRAITKGMEYTGLLYSGKYDFVETNSLVPTTHMVAPKENVVGCIECHTPVGGRMANIKGVYIPGRDRFGYLGYLGWFVILASLAGVLIHAAIRIVSYNRRNK